MDTLRIDTALERAAASGADDPLAPIFAAGGGVLRTTHEAELVRLTRQYADFAGTTRNALNLLSGLRSGSAITLYGEEGELSFTPPTTPMGWSRVQRILNLARAGLTSMGIRTPQPAQIAAALMGGTLAIGSALVRFPGVLRLHSARIEWSRIAHAFALAAPAAGALQHQ
ncbi:MAG: hypothetical protein PHY45_13055 [Rhodocyclaceae bacterium]|nr:hypothetical protein [Rhodocyclaceae bacterium]